MPAANFKGHKFVSAIDSLNEWVGRAASWLLILMVGVTFLNVVLRYVFQVGWVWLQEIVIYAHGYLFLLSIGWALKRNAHVRVDILYQKLSPKFRAWVDTFGALILCVPSCFLIFSKAFPYVADSWRVLEGSKDGGGLECVFLLKSSILIFCALTLAQALSMALRSWSQRHG